MNENPTEQLPKDSEKIPAKLQDLQQYLTEIRILHCFDAIILAGLVAIALQTFTYLLYGPLQTDFDKTLYMFSLLIGPSAFFLLLLHLYELYGFVKKGEKSIPLTLDLMYFIYAAFSWVTMIGLTSYYHQHHISQTFLSTGWNVGALLLCSLVPISLLSAKYIVTIYISNSLPHFFTHSQKQGKKRPMLVWRQIRKPSFKPKQIYYFRKKPDVSLWQNEEYFIRYK